MLEKTGTIVLTSTEISQIIGGVLPDRIRETWGISLETAQQIVSGGSYTVQDNNDNESK